MYTERHTVLFLVLVMIDALAPACSPQPQPDIPPPPLKETAVLVSTTIPTRTQSSYDKAVSMGGSALFVNQQAGRTLLFEHQGPLGYKITIDGITKILPPDQFDSCDSDYCPLFGGEKEPGLRTTPVEVLKPKIIDTKKSGTIYFRVSPDWQLVQAPAPTPNR